MEEREREREELQSVVGTERERVEEEGEEVVVGGKKSYVSLGWICACLFHKKVGEGEGKERENAHTDTPAHSLTVGGMKDSLRSLFIIIC